MRFPRRPNVCVKMQIVHSATVYAVLAPKRKSWYGESPGPRPWKISARRLDVQDFPCRELRSLVISSHLFACAIKRCGPNCLKLHAICTLFQKVDQHKPSFVWFMQRPRIVSAFSGQDSCWEVSNYRRVADAIRKKCCSRDMCFSFGIGKDIDFQRGSKELSTGGGVLNSLANLLNIKPQTLNAETRGWETGVAQKT